MKKGEGTNRDIGKKIMTVMIRTGDKGMCVTAEVERQKHISRK